MSDKKYFTSHSFQKKILRSESPDFLINLKRLINTDKSILFSLIESSPLPEMNESDIIIDAILGTGTNRPIKGFLKKIILAVNHSPAKVVSVDIPSGLFCDVPTESDVVINADYTFTFESPKLSFFFAENEKRVGKFFILPIGLNKTFIESCHSGFNFITPEDVKKIFVPRRKFSHKGNFGHACIMAGSFGKMGAAVLSGRACLRAGAGLLTMYSPKCGYTILQTAVPEAMAGMSRGINYISTCPKENFYTVYGIGPGIGTRIETKKVLAQILKKSGVPLVLDADALNIVAGDKKLFSFIPKNTILTPHPGEFERLFGKTKNSYQRLMLARKKSKETNCLIVLKGCYTAVCNPDGTIWFNSTGNPGMATAGSGDVLLGIITGLLAQGYSPLEAAKMGVYLHGLAGDIAASEKSEESMIAGDIVENLGEAIRSKK